MTSSIFYKFKNSRESERIIFNGTDLSVFELKKEIISASGLGDGSDFNLHIFPQDEPNSELKDDTTLIPRSSTIIAIRRPAPRGQGRAARYVTGKAPSRAISSQSKPVPSLRGGHLENAEDPEAAFLAESAIAWDAQKEALSNAKPVYRKNNSKNVVVPSHPPPPGYVCRRCNIKGHWIQACPTNDDPDFKPVFQAKRTTGIPQSFLKKVEKPVDEEAAKGIMLNADGEYVQVMACWCFVGFGWVELLLFFFLGECFALAYLGWFIWDDTFRTSLRAADEAPYWFRIFGIACRTLVWPY